MVLCYPDLISQSDTDLSQRCVQDLVSTCSIKSFEPPRYGGNGAI